MRLIQMPECLNHIEVECLKAVHAIHIQCQENHSSHCTLNFLNIYLILMADQKLTSMHFKLMSLNVYHVSHA